MANPTGQTYHYGEHQGARVPGGRGVVHKDAAWEERTRTLGTQGADWAHRQRRLRALRPLETSVLGSALNWMASRVRANPALSAGLALSLGFLTAQCVASCRDD